METLKEIVQLLLDHFQGKKLVLKPIPVRSDKNIKGN